MSGAQTLPLATDGDSVGDATGPVVLDVLRKVHELLDTITVHDSGRVSGWASLDGLGAGGIREAVRLQAALEGRVAGLRFHTIAAADAAQAADDTGAVDAGSWAASAVRNRDRAWGALALSRNLEERPHVRAALASGRITEDHAAIIVRAFTQLGHTLRRLQRAALERGEDPTAAVPELTAEELAHCEELMVAKAEYLSPRRLAAAVRRLIEPLRTRVRHHIPFTDNTAEVDLVDVVEHDRLAEQQREAEHWTHLDLQDNGDGTWTGRFIVPALHGQLLQTVLQHYAAPRRRHLTDDRGELLDPTLDKAFGFTIAERMGRALCELIEHLPVDRPVQGPGASAITLAVHIDAEHLRTQVGTATLGGHPATGKDKHTAVVITAGEARRLACNAGIIPIVLGGDSVPLDLGRQRRLFTRHQALALSARHTTCAAAGCDRPFAWCELHHLRPWSHDGPTDLDNAVPLCGHHHRRIHDTDYTHHLDPDGTVRFRTRRSRLIEAA